MLSKILAKTKDASAEKSKEHKELVAKISKMNLTDMRAYINNRILDNLVSEEGLNEILHKLLKVDEKTSKRYIDGGDMDSKIKKSFDLILNILKSKKINVTAIELVNEFLEVSKDIVQNYDNKHKQIYDTKFRNAIILAIDNINKKVELKRKMDVVGS